MPIPTDITIESSFEVVDPVDVAPPGSNFEAYVETGTTQLTLGDQVHTVTFNTEKAALSYVFDELVIYNEVDATPIVLGYIETAKSTTGFELTTTAAPDTGNYYVRWKVRIPTTIVEGAVVATPSTGAVTEVTAVGNDGINASVSNPTTAPTINLSLQDASITEAKLAFTPVTGAVLTPTGAQTVTNKLIDGNNNTLQNIAITAISGAGIITQGMTDPNSDQPVYWDDTAGNFAFRGTPSARGISKDIYISTRSDGKGTGTADDPFDGSTAANFDAIMADGGKTPANCNIYLIGSGTYQSKGFTPRSGWKFHAGQATIQIPVLTAGEAATFIAIFGGNTVPLVSDILIEGGIWDLNMQNQTQAMGPAAIQLICDGLIVQNLKVINFGNTSAGGEEFVIGNFTNGSRDGIIHRKPVRWRNIEFTGLAAGVTNTGTITLLNACGGQNVTTNDSLSNGWFEDVEVTGINAHDIATSDNIAIDVVNTGGWVKNFHGHHNKFKNITGINARYGYYHDTGSIINMVLDHDEIVNVSTGINIAPQTAGSLVDTLIISDELLSSNTYLPIYVDGMTTTVRNVVADHNQIGTPTDTGIYFHGVANGKIRLNTIDSSTNEILTTASTIAERFGNYRLNGTPVTNEIALATVSTSQSLTNKKLGSLTSNGFVKTSSGDGTLSVDTTTYQAAGSYAASGNNNDLTRVYGLADGSNASPSIDFGGSNTGLYRSGGALLVSTSGASGVAFNYGQTSEVKLKSGGKVVFSSADDLTSSSDTEISRASAGVLAMPGISVTDAKNIAFGTSTGTKIGTLGGASGQKMAFWNQTPIVQPVLATGAGASADNIITVLQNLGLVRQS